MWLKTCSCLRLRTGRTDGAVLVLGFNPGLLCYLKSEAKANGFFQKASASEKKTAKESYALA
jgi:hypothetical protein